MHDTDVRPGPTEATLPDTMWEVARRPRWIGALVFALAVAALFAFLGHWQLDRSVESLKPANTGSETRKVLSDITEPQTDFLDRLTGQKVSATGAFEQGDFRVLSGRLNDGKTGYWLVGRFVDSANDATLAVAVGWAPTAAGARAAEVDVPATSISLDGRYLPSEAADDGKFQQGEATVLSVPELINEWNDFSGDVYNGYVVSATTYGDLTAISSPPPIDKATINWLNLFYAVEWAVFAGFAIFLWFRLVRDAFEREIEEAQELLAASNPAAAASLDAGAPADGRRTDLD